MELVLWLPLLLLVGALMINYGTMAVWQLRGHVVARDAAWRARWPRTGQEELPPHSTVWPADARMDLEDEPELSQLEDEQLRQPVVRGPLPNGFVVRPLLDPLQPALRGVAEVERPFPLLASLGSYRSGELPHPLLDNKFQVAEMRLRSNQARRILALYRLPTAPRSLSQDFADAVTELIAMEHFDALSVLDRDSEVRAYHGRYVDFHPAVSSRIYGMDPASVRQTQVNRLIDTRNSDGEVVLGEISHLPRTMTEFFLNLYYHAGDPSLQTGIEQLEAFHSRLPELERQMQEP